MIVLNVMLWSVALRDESQFSAIITRWIHDRSLSRRGKFIANEIGEFRECFSFLRETKLSLLKVSAQTVLGRNEGSMIQRGHLLLN